MNISYRIASRLRINTSGSGSSVGAVIAVVGVALALMIIEFTLAIVVGFKDGIREKLIGFDAQVTVGGPYDPYTGQQSSFVTLTPGLDSEISSALPGTEQRLVLRQPGLLKTDTDFEGVVFIGQRGNGEFSFEKANVVEGVWPDYANDTCRNDIVVSSYIGNALGLGVGDKVFSTFIVGDNVKLRRHRIAGIYESNFGEYDRTVVYSSLATLQGVCGVDSITGNRIDIRGIPYDKMGDDAIRLQESLVEAVTKGRLQDYHPVQSILETGAVYFSWLSLLDTNVVVVFVLMICVSSFTLISSLFILILDRIRMIGILRSMGADRRQIRDIFVFLALRLVGLGMIVGNILGIGLLLVQKFTHVIKLDPEMYYLDSVPVEIVTWQMLLLNIGVIVVAWVVLVLPARMASSVDPSKITNYE